MRARKKLLRSCSLLKETIFRRGLDADRGIGDIVHRYLASRRRMVFLLTTESVFQGCSGLFLNGSLPRHARCATHGSIETSLLLRNKRDDQRYESSLDSDNLLCAVRLCILSDTMRNGTHSISHGALEKMGGTCPSKLCRTYPLCGYEGRSLTLGLQGVDGFSDTVIDDDERSKWVSPPPAKERIQHQTQRDCSGQVGIH
jgi:hypothetical protein